VIISNTVICKYWKKAFEIT